MRHPKPFAVFISGKFSFTVTAYSIEQARAIVAAMIAGEVTIVVAAPDGASR